MTAQLPYQLFVSYSQNNRGWVEGYLLDALQAAGVRVLSELNFAVGAPRITEFERAVNQCERTLLVLSPAYIAESGMSFLNVMVQHYGLESGVWPVIPLILEPVALPPRLAFLVALDATEMERWPDAVARLCQAVQAGPPLPASRPPCPYPGMRAFRREEAPQFYGRESEVADLLQRLRLHPFVAIIGASGSGKSSLVYAGLLPALQRSTLFGAGGWLVRTFRPGAQPLAAMQTALGGVELEQFTPAPLLATEKDAARLLLVIDQFEELFTQGADQVEAFCAAIQRFVALRDCYLVMTVRADFFGDLLASALWPLIQSHRLEIAPLSADGLRAAIVKPAEDKGVFIESALVERLVAGSVGQPGLLPFVQEVLVRLWDKLERRYLPLSAYEALVLPLAGYSGKERSGIQAAMAQLADEMIDRLAEDQQRIARRIFLRLVQFGEGRDNTRRQQPVSALRAAGDDPARFDATLHYLVENRLLVLSGDTEGEPRVDLAHEAMLTGWPRLEGWGEVRKADETTRRRLEDRAFEWVRLNRQGGFLDRSELAETQAWLGAVDANEIGISTVLTEYVTASTRAVNPGWNPLGILVIATALLSFSAWLGLVYVYSFELSPSVQYLIWLVIFVVIGISIVTVWAVLRKDHYQLQKMSHAVRSGRGFSLTIAGATVVAMGLWLAWGFNRVQLDQYCTGSNRGFVPRTTGWSNIALAPMNQFDPYFLNVLDAILSKYDHTRVWIVTPQDAQTCQSYFDRVVAISKSSPTGAETIYVATPLFGTDILTQEVTKTESCQALAKFSYNLGLALQLNFPGVVYNTDLSEGSCRAWLLNEQGMEVVRTDSIASYDTTLLDTAEEIFNESIIASDNSYAVAYNNLGHVLMRKGALQELAKDNDSLYGEAKIAFERASLLLKDHAPYLNDIGVACMALQDYSCAEQHLLESIKLDGNFILAYSNLGRVYADMNRLDAAAEVLVEAKRLLGASQSDPVTAGRDRSSVLRNAGILAFRQGDLSTALTQLEQALKASELFSEEILYFRAFVLLEMEPSTEYCSILDEYLNAPTRRLFGERERRYSAYDRSIALGCES